MSCIKKVPILFLTACCISFCGIKINNKINFLEEIEATYFQKMSEGVNQLEITTNLYILLKKPLKKGITLEKIYFKNQMGRIEITNNVSFVAHFQQESVRKDMILHNDPKKEYGNKVPIIIAPKFNLKANDAVLEYKINGTVLYYTMKAIQEKPMIPNPLEIKPKN